MGRPKKAPGLKEPVKLRKRERKDGVLALYLDIYYKGVRKNEYLNLYLVPERTSADRQKNATTIQIAERIRAQRVIAIQNHQLTDWNIIKRSSMMLETWLEEYDHEDVALSKSAFVNRKKAHDWMKEYMEKTSTFTISLEDVNKEYCRGFINYLRSVKNHGKFHTEGEGLKQTTIHGYVATISAALNKAVREGILDRNPFRLLENADKVARKDSQREFLTLDEMKILIETPIDYYCMKQAFMFSCFTGLRISDILKLTWNDIRLSPDGITQYISTVMEKTKHVVTIPLSKEALRWMPERGEAELVFDLPKSRNTRHKSINNWVKDAKIGKKITFHCARHTFATLMLTLGGDLYTTSKLLGHRNVATTEIYAKIVDQKKVDTVSLVDNLFE
jgi:integrase